MAEEGGRGRRALYVGGLAEEVTTDVLRAAFLPFGDLKDVQVPLDMHTQKNKGFGFVEFEEEADAEAAVENMDAAEIFGRVIRVNFARMRAGRAGKAVWAEADEWYASLREKGADAGEDAEDDLGVTGSGAGGGAGAGPGAAREPAGAGTD